jgi:hypothetical protein
VRRGRKVSAKATPSRASSPIAAMAMLVPARPGVTCGYALMEAGGGGEPAVDKGGTCAVSAWTRLTPPVAEVV